MNTSIHLIFSAFASTATPSLVFNRTQSSTDYKLTYFI